jgi:hypothetical protein
MALGEGVATSGGSYYALIAASFYQTETVF